MELTLTWDLFIGVFMFVIIAYSFIVGINGTLKILLSTYIAILTVEGLYTFLIGFISEETLAGSLRFLELDTGIAFIKIILFIICVVMLTIKGRYEPDFQSEEFYSLELIFIPIFGLLSAALIVGTIVLYINGGGIFSGLEVLTSEGMQILQQESILVNIITKGFSLFFALPAILLITLSFLENE